MARPRKRENQGLPQNLLCRTRTRASGRKVTYYYYVMADGKEKGLGTDKQVAILETAKLNLGRGVNKTIITIADVFARYESEELMTSEKSKNTQKQYKTAIKFLKMFFCNPPAKLTQIEPKHIRMYLEWRKNKPTSANMEISLFHAIWNKARAWGYTSLACPSEGIEKFKLKKRNVYVEDHIFKIFHELGNQVEKDLMDVAYLTAQRPVDVVKIHSNQIIDGVLYIVQEKTGNKIRMAIKGKLEEILNRLKGDGYLFKNKLNRPLSRGVVTGWFYKLRKRAIELYPEMEKDIKEFQFRDIRAKAGTDKFLQTNEDEARQQLGHTSAQMTKRYIRKTKIINPTI
ncbi:integrase [Rodentibacter genomosp. 2]|uniref:tyrosine-type recombinase/integrase n=1 Tax=Rodentibacter genomosp. 2 TaxID=1908266 RepID=UPI000985D3EB|nr:integrase [Rodentibacter genomosp. 2]